jgi:hypothetical protein
MRIVMALEPAMTTPTFCQHEHDEFLRGAYTGVAIGCTARAVPGGSLCEEHGQSCACCQEQFEIDRLDPEATECLDCRAETAALPVALCGECGRRSYREDGAACACCVPARRAADCSETIEAAPSPEALALGARLHGLRTVVACCSGLLLGFAS